MIKNNNYDNKKSMDEEEKNKVLWTRTGTGVRKRIFKFFSRRKTKLKWFREVNIDVAKMGVTIKNLVNRDRFRQQVKFRYFQETVEELGRTKDLYRRTK